MTASEAIEAFRRTWCCATAPSIVVAVGSLRARIDRWVTARPSIAERSAEEEGDTPRSPRAQLGIEEPYVAPRNELERELERLWSQLLGVEGIGVHDDFFRLGGHSLLGTRLVGRVRQEMGVELPIQAIFRSPTIAQMAAEIAEMRMQEADPDLLADVLEEVRTLTPEQIREMLEETAAAGEGA
jgi:hypothetical protein